MNLMHLYFEYLSYLHLHKVKELHAPGFKAFNSGSSLSFCNRVFISKHAEPKDFSTIKNFYNDTPFTLWIDDHNKPGQDLMQALGLNWLTSYPLMLLDLANWTKPIIDKKITVKQLDSQADILNHWISLVARAYHIDQPEFKKLIEYFLASPQASNIQFYIGYYDNTPAATSMVIRREKLVDVHWVGTLAEFRHRGLGLAVSSTPLRQLPKSYETAILYASAMGQSVYEKIGFTTVSKAQIYKINHSKITG